MINLLLLSLLAGGVIPVFALQLSQGDDAKDISPWEKPIAKCWSYDAETVANIPMIPDQKGFLYIPLAEGAVAAVDTATGKQVWNSVLGGEIRAIQGAQSGQSGQSAQPADNGKLIVATVQESDKKDNNSLFLQALSEETGITAWRKELDFSARIFLLVKGGSIFLVREDGNITAFNAVNGDVLWQSNAGVKIPVSPAMTEKSLILGTEDKKLLEINTETGKIGQAFIGSAAFNGSILAAPDSIIYSDQIGNIYAIRLANGELIWKARAGAEVIDISPTEFGLLVSSNDNFVYMLSPTRGDRKWKRKFSGRLLGKPVLHENYGLFVTSAGTEAVILDLTKGKFVNNVSLPEKAFFTGGATGAGGGFALSASQGIIFYAPEGCPKK